MVLGCLTWIPPFGRQLIRTKYEKKSLGSLPDDIMIEILGRLPAECVLKCRLVCRNWLVLTSTPHFVEAHVKRATPLQLVQKFDFINAAKKELCLFIYDGGANSGNVIRKMREGCLCLTHEEMAVIYQSCNGLVLLKPMSFDLNHFYVCNPVTRAVRCIDTPQPAGELCGFFFHSLTKDYRILYLTREGGRARYYIYSLVQKTWRRLSDLSYWPKLPRSSATAKGALHWIAGHNCEVENGGNIAFCTDSIMVFNTDNENFCSMPHPPKKCRSRYCHNCMYLLETNGELTFWYLCSKAILVLWVLEDYGKWRWVEKYRVTVDWDVRLYPFDFSGVQPDYFNDRINLMDIWNDELFLSWDIRGFFRYNLVQKAETRICSWSLCDLLYSATYVKSLVSF